VVKSYILCKRKKFLSRLTSRALWGIPSISGNDLEVMVSEGLCPKSHRRCDGAVCRVDDEKLRICEEAVGNLAVFAGILVSGDHSEELGAGCCALGHVHGVRHLLEHWGIVVDV